MTSDKIKAILDQMATLNEQLLSLTDDMLLEIDPRDNESLQQGLAFITAFNLSHEKYTDAADELEKQIKQYFQVDPEEEEVETETANSKGKIIKELDKTQPYSLDHSFCYKRPYGFVLGNTACKGIKTWKSLYLRLLGEISKRDMKRFIKMADAKEFVTRRGNPLFSSSPDNLRNSVDLPGGIYAEINLSADGIVANIKQVLMFFGLPQESFKLYLREDRNG